MKCLVTRIDDVVNDESLKKYNEIEYVHFIDSVPDNTEIEFIFGINCRGNDNNIEALTTEFRMYNGKITYTDANDYIQKANTNDENTFLSLLWKFEQIYRTIKMKVVVNRNTKIFFKCSKNIRLWLNFDAFANYAIIDGRDYKSLFIWRLYMNNCRVKNYELFNISKMWECVGDNVICISEYPVVIKVNNPEGGIYRNFNGKNMFVEFENESYYSAVEANNVLVVPTKFTAYSNLWNNYVGTYTYDLSKINITNTFTNNRLGFESPNITSYDLSNIPNNVSYISLRKIYSICSPVTSRTQMLCGNFKFNQEIYLNNFLDMNASLTVVNERDRQMNISHTFDLTEIIMSKITTIRNKGITVTMTKV